MKILVWVKQSKIAQTRAKIPVGRGQLNHYESDEESNYSNQSNTNETIANERYENISANTSDTSKGESIESDTTDTQYTPHESGNVSSDEDDQQYFATNSEWQPNI